MKIKAAPSGCTGIALGVVLVAMSAVPGALAAPPPPPPGQWVSIGPAHVFGPAFAGWGEYHAVGRLTTIAVHPTNPQVIYVGSAGELGREGSGIWKTTDGGTSWSAIGDALPTLAVAAIALDPGNPNRVFIATADRGVFRSDDAGDHWLNLSGPLPVRSNTAHGDHANLLVSPADPAILYLTTDDGVLRSTDGGQTWPVSLSAGAWATNVVMDPLHPDVLYASIVGRGVYKTTDGGVNGSSSWQLQTQPPLPSSIPGGGTGGERGPLLAISHPPADASETVYALYPTFPLDPKNLPGWALFRTIDGGGSWSGPLYSCAAGTANCMFVAMAADPANNDRVAFGFQLLFTGEIGVTPITQVPLVENDRQPASPHGDYWELTFDPTNSQNVIAGSDGGIYLSTNHGLEGSWSFIGAGITNVEMYDLAQAATQPSRVIAGTQDNGNLLYSGSLVWDHIPPTQVQGGDGAAVAIDPTDADTLYDMGQVQDSLVQSLNAGPGPFLPFASGLPSSSGTTCAMFNSTFFLQVHPTVPTTLLASCDSLYRTLTNVSPGNWSVFFPPPAGRVVRSAIDAVGDLYYAGTDTGRVFAVPDDGSTAQDIFPPHPQSVSDIEVDPARPEDVYVSFAPPFTVNRGCAATAGQSRIYRLIRTSLFPSPTFAVTDITGNLQSTELCVSALAVDPSIPRTLYAGTNRGVYRGRSNASGGPWVWQAYNSGMPLADVRDLEVHPVTGNIDAATYGRSAFELVPETVLSIGIDIKPGSSENPINIRSHGKIPVAVLASPTFDAPNEVERASLLFGRTGTQASLAKCNPDPQDVNADGLPDLICHFYASLAAFQVGDTMGYLTGMTFDGAPIAGSDKVKIVP